MGAGQACKRQARCLHSALHMQNFSRCSGGQGVRLSHLIKWGNLEHLRILPKDSQQEAEPHSKLRDVCQQRPPHPTTLRDFPGRRGPLW